VLGHTLELPLGLVDEETASTAAPKSSDTSAEWAVRAAVRSSSTLPRRIESAFSVTSSPGWGSTSSISAKAAVRLSASRARSLASLWSRLRSAIAPRHRW
jgi:hypothetical protein